MARNSKTGRALPVFRDTRTQQTRPVELINLSRANLLVPLVQSDKLGQNWGQGSDSRDWKRLKGTLGPFSCVSCCLCPSRLLASIMMNENSTY